MAPKKAAALPKKAAALPKKAAAAAKMAAAASTRVLAAKAAAKEASKQLQDALNARSPYSRFEKSHEIDALRRSAAFADRCAKALARGKAPPPRPACKKAKPILYLYPASPCAATVTLRLTDGSRFTTLLPLPQSARRSTATWLVAAQRDGTLQPPTGPPVASLFWEATPSREALLLPEGARDTFCVPGPGAGVWLLEALRAWGLQPREYTECASYWAPLMAEFPFVQVRAVPQAAWEALAPLAVEGMPAPLRCLRIFLAWRGLRGYEAGKDLGSLPPPPPPRSASASYAVEWGGQQLAALQ